MTFASHPNRAQSWFDNGEARFVAFIAGGDSGSGVLRPNPNNSDGAMIIDCHGHYTTEPKDLLRWRKEQVDNLKNPAKRPAKTSLKVSDGEIRDSLEGAQLKLQRERGTDVTIFSPRAMGMSDDIGDCSISV